MTSVQDTAPRRLLFVGAALVASGLVAFVALSGPLAPRVPLRTYADLRPSQVVGCYAANTTGLLIVDATAGTAIVSEDMAKSTVPVTWPKGYTARRTLFGQVEVLDSAGHPVATTGNRYELLGGYTDDLSWLACGSGGVLPPAWPYGEMP